MEAKRIVRELREVADLLEDASLDKFYVADFSLQTNSDEAFQALRERLEPLDLRYTINDEHSFQNLDTRGSSLTRDERLNVRVACARLPAGYSLKQRAARLEEELRVINKSMEAEQREEA